jgi:hypothetical protein
MKQMTFRGKLNGDYALLLEIAVSELVAQIHKVGF